MSNVDCAAVTFKSSFHCMRAKNPYKDTNVISCSSAASAQIGIDSRFAKRVCDGLLFFENMLRICYVMSDSTTLRQCFAIDRVLKESSLMVGTSPFDRSIRDIKPSEAYLAGQQFL